MVEIPARRPAVNDRLTPDDDDAFGVQTGGEVAPYLLRVAVRIFENADLDQFARFKAVGKTFKHIFADTFLAHLTDGVEVCRDGF